MPVATTQAALRAYYFIIFGSVGLYLPYFPTWLRAQGFTGAAMGALMALLPTCQLLSPAIVGILSDKLGLRGRMMSWCVATAAAGLTALTLAAVSLNQIPFVLAASFILVFAIARAPIVGLADVLAMETAPDYGKIRLWGSLGFMVAALLGGTWVDPTHPWILPAVVGALVWLLLGVTFLLPKTSHLPPRPALSDARALLTQGGYRRLLVTVMFVFGGMTAYDLCLTLRLRQLSATGTQIGLFWSVATCAEVVLLFFSQRLLRRIGPGKLLTFSLLISTLRWLFLSQATDLSLMLALQPLHAIAFGLMWVSAVATLKRELGEKGTGTGQGLFASAIALGGVVGINTWGTVFDAFGSEVVFLGAACSSMIAAVLASTLIRFSKQAELSPADVSH